MCDVWGAGYDGAAGVHTRRGSVKCVGRCGNGGQKQTTMHTPKEQRVRMHGNGQRQRQAQQTCMNWVGTSLKKCSR